MESILGGISEALVGEFLKDSAEEFLEELPQDGDNPRVNPVSSRVFLEEFE